MITGIKKDLLSIRVIVSIYIKALKYYRTLSDSGIVVKQLLKNRANIYGNPDILKYAKADRKYYWSSDIPGWPSEAYNKYIHNEFIRVISKNNEKSTLQTVIFSITSCCPLRCTHCYEFNNLALNEKLSLTDLRIILNKFVEKGIFHIQLSGGEPLARFEDLLSLIEPYKGKIAFWLLTSGYELTEEKALLLKKAGIVGAHISLDHWDENLHNNFRNNPKSFEWVKEAVKNCRNADILTSLSLCASKEFLTEENLWKYLKLAEQWGVNIIRILEPRSVGRFNNKIVEFEPEHFDLLDKFYLELSNNSHYSHFPIIDYPGFHQRRGGCFGSGNRYLFTDSNGEYHACPFCQKSHGNALEVQIDSAIASMKESGCHKFQECKI